jgi:tetratricopeptide (TPR) repeat protein
MGSFSLKGPHDPMKFREEILRERLVEDPDDAMALALLSTRLYLRGRRDEALAHARRAVAIDPDNAYAHYALSCALIAAGSNRRRTILDAMHAANRAISLGHKHVSYYIQLVYLNYLRVHTSSGRRHAVRGLEAVEHAARLDPLNARCAGLTEAGE